MTPEAQALAAEHLGLVIFVARKYHKTGPLSEDTIAAGNLGLVEAARRFDSTRGIQFNTYAVTWVKACILENMIRTRGPVRIGTRRAERQIFYNLGRARRVVGDDPEKLAAELTTERYAVTAQDVIDMLPRMLHHDGSLDDADSSERSRHETVSDHGATPEEVFAEIEDASEQQLLLKRGLAQLDDRERLIIKGRYLREEPYTLLELSIKLGISRERVRQLEMRALAKLKEMV